MQLCLDGKLFISMWFLTFVLSLTSCGTPSEQLGTANPTLTFPPSPTPTSSPTITPASPTDWSSRWLKGIPCQPPCWEGITPGQTNGAEALEKLRANTLVLSAEAGPSPLLPTLGAVTWRWTNGYQGGEAWYPAQTSTQTIYAIAPSYGITYRLSEIIQAYGEPSHVLAIRTGAGDTTKFSYYLWVIYLSQGFALGASGPIKPDPSRDGIFGGPTFFVPTMDGLNKIVITEARNHPEWLVPWQEGKNYDFYCREAGTGNICPKD